MSKAHEIAAFIQETFSMYDMAYDQFFHTYDEKTDTVSEIPLVVKGKLDRAIVKEAAVILGLSEKALLEMDEKETRKWREKFGYFQRIHEFHYVYRCSLSSEEYELYRFLDRIFDSDTASQAPTRYDYHDVARRMKALLQQIDESLPGTYHPYAEITDLRITTENFCHYPAIEALVNDYFSMIDRAKVLFFKAWEGELPVEEQQEYNFLAYAIGLQDLVMSSLRYLDYGLLKNYIPIYKEEGYSDFFDYVKIDHHRVLRAWKCAEFVENRELVRKMLQLQPPLRGEMRRFAMEVSKFDCWFTWSDALPVRFSPEEEAELDMVDDILGLDHIDYADRAKEKTNIFVPKTAKEMQGDEVFAQKLNVLMGPEKLGGIELTEREKANNDSKSRFNRMMRRFGRKNDKGGLPHAGL